MVSGEKANHSSRRWRVPTRWPRRGERLPRSWHGQIALRFVRDGAGASVDLHPCVADEDSFDPAGDFDVEGHRVRLRARYWRRPAANSRLLERWRAVAANAAFFHVQQTGSRPTLVGVICGDEVLGRQFVLELLCGGWGWHARRRRHVLLEVAFTHVHAYEGPHCRPTTDLAELASGHVLPRARDRAHRGKAERQRQRAVAASLAAHRWLRARHQAASFAGDPAACAAARRDGKTVLVTGATDQEEAGALAEALAQGSLWSPRIHGHLHVHCDTSELELTLESFCAEAERRLLHFVRGFGRQVILSDLHLGVPPRDTFGPGKGRVLAALIRQVIRDRCTLVLNGDFLELLHERHGEIRRAYPEVFDLLPRVRRLLYLAGNHDDGILRENLKRTRRSTRNLAVRHAYGRVTAQSRGTDRGMATVSGLCLHSAAHCQLFRLAPLLDPVASP